MVRNINKTSTRKQKISAFQIRDVYTETKAEIKDSTVNFGKLKCTLFPFAF